MTAALEGGDWSAANPGRSSPQERPSTLAQGGCVGNRAGLNGRNEVWCDLLNRTCRQMNCRFRTVKQFQNITLYFVSHSYWLDRPGIESLCRRYFQHFSRPHHRLTQRPTNEYQVFHGEKRPECGIDHSTTSSAKVKERVKLYSTKLFLLHATIWGVFHQQQTCSGVGVAQCVRLHG